LENNKIPLLGQGNPGEFPPGGAPGMNPKSTLEPSSTYLGDTRSKTGSSFMPNAMNSAFQKFPGTGDVNIGLNALAANTPSISSLGGDNKDNKLVKPNQISQKKKLKKESNSNKRTPAKLPFNRPDYAPKSFKNDGGGDDDDDEDGEGEDDEEEDPDLKLFMTQQKSGTPNASSKSPKQPAGESSAPKSALKPTGAFEFKPIGTSSAIASQGNSSGLKLKSMKDVKSSINGSTPASSFKAEELKLPSTDMLQNKLNDPAKSISFNLNNDNSIKFGKIEPKGQNVKREKKKDDGDEDLSDISLTDEEFETQDQLFCQYIKVNRTKQRYR